MRQWWRRLKRFGRDLLALWIGVRDPRVPMASKLVAAAGLFYAFLPLDLIPDVLPVIGWLDDAAMLPLAVYVASRLIPTGILEELRERADLAILRHGGRITRLAIAILALWLILACIGAWTFWRGRSRSVPPPEATIYETYNLPDLRELKNPPPDAP